jgi:hypothetical protein
MKLLSWQRQSNPVRLPWTMASQGNATCRDHGSPKGCGGGPLEGNSEFAVSPGLRVGWTRVFEARILAGGENSPDPDNSIEAL